MNDVRMAFLEAVDAGRSVVAAPKTRQRWHEASVLPQFTVKGLAGHLARAATTVVDYLEAPEPDGEPIPGPAYFARLGPAPDLESPAAMSIRQRGEEMAAAGWKELLARFDSTRTRLEQLLAAEPASRNVKVAGDQVMLLDDYLPTRIVELAVHTDDLAVSVGLEAPALPSAAMDVALRHLLEVARCRHGDAAVLRAFSRRERDDVQALRIF